MQVVQITWVFRVQTLQWQAFFKGSSSTKCRCSLSLNSFGMSLQRPPPLFGTYRYPVFIYILILTVSSSHWSIIFVDNIGHVYRNFFLFLLISSFSLLNWFWTKAVWYHDDCSIILPNYNSLFLTLIGRMCNLRVPCLSSEHLCCLKWELLSCDQLSKYL